MRGLFALALAALALPVSSISSEGISNVVDEQYWHTMALSSNRKFCYVSPDANGGDDAPAIMKALNEDCHTNGLVVFSNGVFNIKTNMTTLNLNDVIIRHYGRFLWSTDIDYWLSVSMPIGFQNQSTLWYFGGDKVDWNGFKTGTFDGNGQVWYDWARSQGNMPRRPMPINFRYLTNSNIEGLNFVQSQMWTMAVSYSQYVDMTDIYVNNTSTSQWSTLNTDGCDTINSDHITFRRWDVTNGDDCIALKGNSTNISVYDTTCRDGQGIAIGSLAQYNGWTDIVENFYASNLVMINTAHVSYLKTWGGISNGFPPNGGGGGLGHGSNITIENVIVQGIRQEPCFIWQCENYEGLMGTECDTSTFHFSDIAWRNISGTATSSVIHAGHIQCSAAADGCDHIEISDMNVTNVGTGSLVHQYLCTTVHDPIGFACTD